MSKQKFIIAGNWKMNPESLKEAKKVCTGYNRLSNKYENIDFRLSPPSVFLAPLGRQVHQGVKLVAQDIYYEDKGSYTGAVSIPMVRDVGASGVLIGHSERRNIFGVSEELIAQKITSAIKHKTPMIVCFGEDTRDEAGKYTEILEQQLESIMTPFLEHNKLSLLTLAYEPVWAIGESAQRSVTEDELFSTILLIKNILTKHVGKTKASRIPIIYGGSVNRDNAKKLAAVPGVKGFLIGRASRDIAQLQAICETVSSK